MSNLSIHPQVWLADLFECEFCAECSGDACHHEALPILGNWFARCIHAPADDGTPAPVVQAYRNAYEELHHGTR